MDFIASGLVELVAGVAVGAGAVRLRLVGAAGAAGGVGRRRTGCCARAACGRTATPTRCAPRSATPTTPTASPSTRRPAKELRLFGLAGWVDRPLRRHAAAGCTSCSARRRGCARSRWLARARSIVVAANVVVFWSLGRRRGRRPSSTWRGVVVFVQAAIGDRHDRVRRAELGARRRGRAGGRRARLEARDGAGRRAAPHGRRSADRPAGAAEIRFRDVTFAYPRAGAGARRRSTSRSRPARRWRSSGVNGAGKTTLAKLLCRLYDPQRRRDRGRRRRPARPRPRRRGAAASPPCSRTSSGSSCRCAHNVAPAGAPDDVDPRRARRRRRRPTCADLDTVLAQGLPGRHRPVGRPVAAGRAGPGAVRGALGRRRGAARRADRAARRARRGGDLRAGPRRHARTARRSSSRTGSPPCASPTASACIEHGRVVELGTPRRADGARRPLPDDVRAAGVAVHRRSVERRRGQGGGP